MLTPGPHFAALSASHRHVSILMCLPLVNVSVSLRVIVNESTLGLFNDASCHGNSLLLCSDWEEKKKGAAAGLRGVQVYCVWVGQTLCKMQHIAPNGLCCARRSTAESNLSA